MRPERAPDFDARAQHYDTLRPQNDAWWSRFHALVELGDLRGRRILDIGCGTGQLASALVDQARAKVWGVDPSIEMLRVARERVPRGVGVRQARAEALPFRDAWFERATMSLVVDLVDRPAGLRRGPPGDSGPGEGSRSPLFAHEHFEGVLAQRPVSADCRDRPRALSRRERSCRQSSRRQGSSPFGPSSLSSFDELDRETALERIRGRHISTFDLLDEDEIDEGTQRAEAELPDLIVRRFEQLVVVAA